MKTKETVLSLGVLIFCLFLMYHGYIYWVAFILFCHCLYQFMPISQQVLRIIKSAFAIKFYNIIIWFVSYVLSLKLLNFTTGIEENNLKFAPAIIAMPLSALIIFIIIMLVSSFFVIVAYVTHQFSLLLPDKIRVLVKNSQLINFAERFPNIIMLLLPFLFLVFISLPIFLKMGLLADATFVSDCGNRVKSVMYLRINPKKCYKYTLDRFVFTKEPVVIISDDKQ